MATLIVVLAGLTWRVVRHLLAFPIWGDEAFVAVNFVTRDYAGMIRPLDYGQIVPLMFMWAELAVTHVWGLGELALRAVPFAAGVISLLLFWRFANRQLPVRAGFLATGMMAAAYYPVRHASEVKPYATDLLVALVLIHLTWRVLARPRNFLTWSMLAVAIGASVWASYPAIFIGCTIVSLLVVRAVLGAFAGAAPSERESARHAAPVAKARLPITGAMGVGAVFAINGAAMYLTYASPHAQAASKLTQIPMWAETFPPIEKIWRMPRWLWDTHTGNMLAYPVGGKEPASLATLLLVIVGSVALWKKGRRELLWLLLGPLVFTFAAAMLKKYPYGGSARTSLYMAPAFCLLAGYGFYVLLKRLAPLRHRWLQWMPSGVRHIDWRATPAMLACALLFIGICGGGVIADIIAPARSLEVAKSRRLVRDIASQTHANDRWVVFNATTPVDYAPYLGDWMGVGGQWVFDVMRFAPVKCDWAPRPNDVEPPSGRLILLAYEYTGKKATFPDAQLDAYVTALETRFGTPNMQREVIKEKNKPNEPPQVEAQRVYTFPESAKDR
ncbi:MAG: glycosyltransferase family 39 protein [Phycisphaerales bacterium]|nr:glycosyltransferase family 39 protein [Phycisphaerales bacterium]